MPVRALVKDILLDEHLTRGLGDAEARMLVEWLVEWVEIWEQGAKAPPALDMCVSRLCRRGRAISRFVRLWCWEQQQGAAIQLAASEHCEWPLPTERDADPCDVMAEILRWENDVRARSEAA